jgi:very-short-patch-repair endonuclease
MTSHNTPFRRFCSRSCATKYRNLIYGNPTQKTDVKKKLSQILKEKYQKDEKFKEHLKKIVAFRDYKKYLNVLKENGKRTIDLLKKQGRFENWYQKGATSALRKMRRDYKPSTERVMEGILTSLQVKYVWNKPLRTPIGTKFPDFIVKHNPPIIIEIDGEWHHKRIEQDTSRNKTFLEMGYTVLRFSSYEIKKYPSLVKKFIEESLKVNYQLYRSWALGNGKLWMLSTLPSQKQITSFLETV